MEEFFRDMSSYLNKSMIAIFGQAEKKKFCKSKIKAELKGAQCFGSINACECIFDNHRKNPYKSVDEIIGDLQIISVESFEKGRKALRLQVKPHTIEDSIEELKGNYGKESK